MREKEEAAAAVAFGFREHSSEPRGSKCWVLLGSAKQKPFKHSLTNKREDDDVIGNHMQLDGEPHYLGPQPPIIHSPTNPVKFVLLANSGALFARSRKKDRGARGNKKRRDGWRISLK